MNYIANIFQRSSCGSPQERQQEAARLTDYADRNGLRVVSIYLATGEPNMLTIDMLINGCMAREKCGHVLLAALSRLWIGDDTPEAIGMVEAAGESTLLLHRRHHDPAYDRLWPQDLRRP